MVENRQGTPTPTAEWFYTDAELRWLLAEVEAGKDRLLTPGQVGKMCSVDPKTVTRWCQNGKLRSVRLGGKHGHRRYSEKEVHAKIFGMGKNTDMNAN